MLNELTPYEEPEDLNGSGLPEAKILDLQKCEAAINDAIRTTAKGLFVIGLSLTTAKGILRHGEFEPWVADRWPFFAKRTGERYMAVHRELGTKSDTLSHLDVTSLHLLAKKSTPASVREDVVKRCGNGEKLDRKAIENLIAVDQAHPFTTKVREAIAKSRMSAGDELIGQVVSMIDPLIVGSARHDLMLLLQAVKEERFVPALITRLKSG